ncbi:hypothetical protein DZE39_005522 [Clostridium beijerinckii]|nr:hypothetical protein [Clostridium beijerinckii]
MKSLVVRLKEYINGQAFVDLQETTKDIRRRL